MKKDKITSAILILLVISSVVLTVKIWISEELWPEGRNFFVNKENFLSCMPFSDKEKPEPEAVAPLHETVFMPSAFAVSVSGMGSSIYSGDDSAAFAELNDLSKKILYFLMNSEEKGTEVTKEEYCDSLKSRSVFVKYPVSLPIKVIGHMCEVNVSPVFDEIASIKDFSIIRDSSSDNAVLVYLHNSKKDKIIKYKISHCRSLFEDAVSEYGGKNAKFVSAYELGFCKSDIEIEQNIVFDPFVFIDTSNIKTETGVITGKSPFDKKDPSELDIESINRFISAFGYNPNSVRRYTDHNGTLVFVENYSTIKLYKNGMLEYTTTTLEKGMDMQIHSDISNNPQNIPDSVDSVYEILGNVWNILSAGEIPDVRLSTDLTDNYSDYSMTFDYRYNGLPVIINSGDIKHAIEIKIQNNKLVSLKAYIRSYSETENYIENPTSLDALDGLFEEFSANSEASDLFLGYVDYGTNSKINTYWNILSENGEAASFRVSL